MTINLQPIQISKTIEQFQALTRVNVQPNWYSCTADLSPADATPLNPRNSWSKVQLNEKGHIAWPAGEQVLWLTQRLVIPQHLQGYPLAGLALRLVVTWWAKDAQIYVNGQLVQSGDLFDASTRILLSPAVEPSTEITVALRLVSPGHDAGALVRSLCVYEHPQNGIDPGFVADELAILQHHLETFYPEKLETLTTAISDINWEALPDRLVFDQSLSTLRQKLRQSLDFPSQLQPPNSKISLLGHAHLDLAWLWSISETWDVAQRTFASVLKLQQDFPELIFCHSTPALYAWIEQHCPDLFSAIQQQVTAGRWEVVGGTWVEPELNIINGESIARQLLYGQRYVQEKFGQTSQVAWFPDSFGFCATLPQLLKLGGIEYFVTQKLRWNDTTKFPYGAFWWQAPDGSQLFSYMSAPIGEGIDPLKMTAYSAEWEIQTGLKNALWLPGVGDHGGGPTRDMLEVARRWQQSPFFPQLEFTTAQTYLSGVRDQGSKINSIQNAVEIPVWHDELYLEFHRGCYTTHADQKRWNRRCEGLLYQAELFASLATISHGTPYPKAELEAAWKKVLFNQFHDILPGTSIPPVFVEANQAWQEVEQVGSQVLDQSLNAITAQISFPSPPQADALPLIVFNSLSWKRSEVVAVSLPEAGEWQIFDLTGKLLPTQLSQDSTHLFFTADVPAIGYCVFWLCRREAETLDNALLKPEYTQKRLQNGQFSGSIPLQNSSSDDKKSFPKKDWVLENEFLQVIVDVETGNLSSIFDKVNQRDVLHSAEGNQLQAFQDSGQYWDAWNIDPNYTQHPLPSPQLKSIHWVEQGQIQQQLQVILQLGRSEFCQDYILSAGSPVLKIATTVDWQERHILVKAAFPLNLQADFATYEIPCGAIQRPTKPQTSAEQAKWEVPALQWADLGVGTGQDSSRFTTYGVSLLNDCKYGYDSQPNQLRLTLLRSPNWPDPEADRGEQEFTYALYPHAGSWKSAHTVRRGYELNFPLQVRVCPLIEVDSNASLPPVAQLLNLSAENLILMALKQAEDEPEQWILRCYECHGDSAELSLQSNFGLAITQAVDLLERPIDAPQLLPDSQSINIEPWKIVSLIVERKTTPPGVKPE